MTRSSTRAMTAESGRYPALSAPAWDLGATVAAADLAGLGFAAGPPLGAVAPATAPHRHTHAITRIRSRFMTSPEDVARGEERNTEPKHSPGWGQDCQNSRNLSGPPGGASGHFGSLPPADSRRTAASLTTTGTRRLRRSHRARVPSSPSS